MAQRLAAIPATEAPREALATGKSRLVLGGLVFGPVGLLAGPLILPFFLVLIRLYTNGPQPAA